MIITPEKLDEIILRNKDTSQWHHHAKAIVHSINNSVEYKKILENFVERFYDTIKLGDSEPEIVKAEKACSHLMVLGSVLIEIGYQLAKDGVNIYDAI